METLVDDITTLHHDSIPRWKMTGVILCQDGLLRLVEENHAFNFALWGAEDRARRDDRGFEFVYHAKREIDHCNQQRNDRMEAIDHYLFKALVPAAPGECPVHSETPGMMIDRLSILALKIYHMQLQTIRDDADQTHLLRCMQKLETLRVQAQQLRSCLHGLLDDISQNRRTFRVYYQCKMYNDPRLNPALYAPED